MGRLRRYQRCARYPDGKHRWKDDGVTCYCGYLRTDVLPAMPPAPTKPRKESRVVRLDADLVARVERIEGRNVRKAMERIIRKWLDDNDPNEAF
jgi:hypothetical protein